MSLDRTISYLSHGLISPPGADDRDAVIVAAGGNYIEPLAADLRLGTVAGAGDYEVTGTLRPYPSAATAEADNTLVALRQLLLDRAALVALVDVRVYCQNLPSADVAILPCVLLYRIGGRDDPYMPTVFSPQYEIKCFGRTQAEAQRIYRTIAPLNGQSQIATEDYFFHFMEEDAAGRDTLEEVSSALNWDCVSSQWNAEVSVA